MKYLILLIDKNDLLIVRFEIKFPITNEEKLYTWDHDIIERSIVEGGEIIKTYTLFKLGTNLTTTIELLYKYNPQDNDSKIQLYGYNIETEEDLLIKTRIIE